jgi:hypothetical protein
VTTRTCLRAYARAREPGDNAPELPSRPRPTGYARRRIIDVQGSSQPREWPCQSVDRAAVTCQSVDTSLVIRTGVDQGNRPGQSSPQTWPRLVSGAYLRLTVSSQNCLSRSTLTADSQKLPGNRSDVCLSRPNRIRQTLGYRCPGKLSASGIVIRTGVDQGSRHRRPERAFLTTWRRNPRVCVVAGKFAETSPPATVTGFRRLPIFAEIFFPPSVDIC